MTHTIGELLEIARAATPGPWSYWGGSLNDFGEDCSMSMEWIPNGSPDGDEYPINQNREADGKFIATFDPPMVRSLIERAVTAETGVCSGCGTSHTMESLRAAGKVSCCPERKMLSAKEWADRAEAAERRAIAAEEALKLAEADLWHRLWNALGHESSLARGLSHLGETRFREILRTALSSTEAQAVHLDDDAAWRVVRKPLPDGGEAVHSLNGGGSPGMNPSSSFEE